MYRSQTDNTVDMESIQSQTPQTPKIPVSLLVPSAKLPIRVTPGSAGFDLFASETVTILTGSRALVPTGIAMAIPPGYYGRIAPRSGLSVRTGLVVNAGVIDSDYRGEIKVLLQHSWNSQPHENVTLNAGERIAQIIIEKIGDFDLVAVPPESLPMSYSLRGTGGFGSTGN